MAMTKESKTVAIIANDEFNLARKIKSGLESDWALNIQQFKNFDDYKIGYINSGLFIAIITKSNHLQSLIKLLNTLSRKKTKIMVISKTLTPNTIQIFRKLGVDETYPLTIGPSKLIDRAKELIVEMQENDRYQVKDVAPLNDPSDFWIVENKKGYKFFQNNWFAYMVGPSPSVGEWVKNDYDSWEWKPTVPNDPIYKNYTSRWEFFGNKPVFVKNLWLFSGKNPSLLLRRPVLGDIYRLRTRDNSSTLEVTRNSNNAYALIEAIENTHLRQETNSTIETKPLSGSITSEPAIDKYLKSGINSNFSNRLEQLRSDRRANSNESGKTQNNDKNEDSIGSFSSSHFQSITEFGEKLKYLNGLCEQRESIILWTKGQKVIAHASAYPLNDTEYGFLVHEDASGKALTQLLESKRVNELFVRGNLDIGSIFFKINNPNFTLKDIEVYVPEEMWKVQRRRTSRLKVDGRKKMMVKITLSAKGSDTLLEYPIRDIGVGGMAFLIPSKDTHHFKTGKVIKQIVFDINSRPMQGPANIRWSRKIKKQDQLQGFDQAIGLEFMYINDDDQEFINRYILEELYTKSVEKLSK